MKRIFILATCLFVLQSCDSERVHELKQELIDTQTELQKVQDELFAAQDKI